MHARPTSRYILVAHGNALLVRWEKPPYWSRWTHLYPRPRKPLLNPRLRREPAEVQLRFTPWAIQNARGIITNAPQARKPSLLGSRSRHIPMQYKMQPEMLRLLVLGRQRMAIRNRAKHAALHQHVAMPRKVCKHKRSWAGLGQCAVGIPRV